MNYRKYLLPALLAILLTGFRADLAAQQTEPSPAELMQKISDLEHRFDELAKGIDDILWYQRVGDVAYIDKIYITGPPPARVKNPTAMGAGNPLKFYSYVFIPRWINPGDKYPLIVLPHGGVQADFTTYHTHIISELMAQGYLVVAPEYR